MFACCFFCMLRQTVMSLTWRVFCWKLEVQGRVMWWLQRIKSERIATGIIKGLLLQRSPLIFRPVWICHIVHLRRKLTVKKVFFQIWIPFQARVLFSAPFLNEDIWRMCNQILNTKLQTHLKTELWRRVTNLLLPRRSDLHTDLTLVMWWPLKLKCLNMPVN